MSDGLTRSASTTYSATPFGPLGSRPDRGIVLRLALLIAAYVGAGVGAGHAWRHLWSPPMGVVSEGRWIPVPVEESLQTRFSAEAWFVLVALVLGLALGLLTALLLDRAEILAVLVAGVGAAVAAVVMMTTGERLSPPDPTILAATAADGTTLPGMLSLDLRAPGEKLLLGAGWTVLLAAPAGALGSVGLVYLGTARRGSRGRQV